MSKSAMMAARKNSLKVYEAETFERNQSRKAAHPQCDYKQLPFITVCPVCEMCLA